jgi:creatinine amidohydrolase/Fe(II)-dependent formamide hydrolase-like protein
MTDRRNGEPRESPAASRLYAYEDARRSMLHLLERRRDMVVVVLPALCLGPDTVGHPGSVEVSPRVTRDAIVATGDAMARAGLRGLVLTNFHGGPRHGIALESAARTLRKRHPGFLALAPTGEVFARIFADDQGFRDKVRRLADVTDAELAGLDGELHAGLGETSAVLSERGDLVHPDYTTLPRLETGTPRWVVRAAKALRHLGPLVGRARARSLARDTAVLVDSLGWLRRPWMSYVGEPALAREAVGEAFLQVLSEEVALIVDDVLASRRRPDDLDHLGWTLRHVLALPAGFPFQRDAPA